MKYAELGKSIKALGESMEALRAKRAELSDEWDEILRRDSEMCAELNAAAASPSVGA